MNKLFNVIVVSYILLMLMSIFLKKCLTLMLIALIICMKSVVKPIIILHDI